MKYGDRVQLKADPATGVVQAEVVNEDGMTTTPAELILDGTSVVDDKAAIYGLAIRVPGGAEE